MRINHTLALSLAIAAVGLTPAAALASHGGDDPTLPADDHGTLVEPGDDNGTLVEPGDDNGGAVEPGDDNGTGVEPGDDNGGAVEPGDDKGGATKREAKHRAGSCTGGSHAKLKVKHSGGRLETEFEVDQNRDGAKWTVRLRRNGKSVVKTSAITKGPSGSFSVARRIGDRAGSDRIVAKATSRSGEVCKATVTI
jgi:hypothetical protein